ncbi:hypothetical protein PsAD37_04164 [Pseudovibrio sp. Ad37]|nr:hypothetical protein PsAD37_04164 [Pseudovibrio sp. Ad37]KZL20547.1 hypothetical protein PsWM33_04300 [Pseudovibrio sp. WM33]
MGLLSAIDEAGAAAVAGGGVVGVVELAFVQRQAAAPHTCSQVLHACNALVQMNFELLTQAQPLTFVWCTAGGSVPS